MTVREQCIVFIVASAAVMASPASVAAQQGPALIREGIGAYNAFDPQRALPLLRSGVDPKAGPRDSLWALGVQYLAQILYEQGDEGSGRAWIRWAVRLAPDLKLDTLNLLSPVIAEFVSARGVTAPGPDDARVGTEWVWPSVDPGSGPGRLELRPDGTPASVVQATVAHHGTLAPRLSLAAGSYEIEAHAPGYRPVRVTREVLPGITTLLGFTLQPEPPPPVAAVPKPPARAPPVVPPPPVAVQKKGGFPWALMVLGAVGAGTAAALLKGKNGGGPPAGGGGTGSITISVPNP